MSVVYPRDMLSYGLVGKLGNDIDPDPFNIFGIYRRRPTKRGITYVKNVFYVPFNPQTEPQQAWRAVFSGGVIAWQALNPGQQDTFKLRVKYLPLTGFNLFMREYLLAQ